MTTTTVPTIRLRKSPKGRNFGWRCTCEAWCNTTSEDACVLMAELHAANAHPHGSIVERGGLLRADDRAAAELPVVGMSSSLTTGGGKGGLVDRLGSVSQSTTPQAQQ